MYQYNFENKRIICASLNISYIQFRTLIFLFSEIEHVREDWLNGHRKNKVSEKRACYFSKTVLVSTNHIQSHYIFNPRSSLQS